MKCTRMAHVCPVQTVQLIHVLTKIFATLNFAQTLKYFLKRVHNYEYLLLQLHMMDNCTCT